MNSLFKKIRLRSLAFLLVIIYLAASLVSSQFELMTRKSEYENTLERQKALRAEVDETQALLREGEDRVYIEMVARQRLGYARPGEIIFVDVRSE